MLAHHIVNKKKTPKNIYCVPQQLNIELGWLDAITMSTSLPHNRSPTTKDLIILTPLLLVNETRLWVFL